MEKQLKIKDDCRHFRPDRPCAEHKKRGTTCGECSAYSPFDKKILIIKLDALGDVLRTTSILTPLKRKYPDSLVYWLTLANATAALENIGQIDKVMAIDSARDSFWTDCMLSDEDFDIVINTDASYKCAALARRANAKTKLGFVLDARGKMLPQNAAASDWFMMGVNDRVKKRNTRTYQSIIADILELDADDMPILVNLRESEAGYGRAVLAANANYNPELPTLGINPGSGVRWPQKRWVPERYVKLIRRVKAEAKVNIALLGGPEEKEINAWILKQAGNGLIDTGTGHCLREFMGVVGACDTVVCADTICMHIAVGLRKNTVAIFGPTSAAEIDLYGRGAKVVTRIECGCCYRTDCTKNPNCMDVISVEEVFGAVTPYLSK